MAEDDNTVTLGEVLAFQDHLEESAAAVLGAADDKNCTYSEGYLKRQALYACLTCIPDICDSAGFCLACNYSCHEGHNIVELYTKRNFRCDCGNEKFGGKKCNLQPNKDPINKDNQYNQNFKGKYCTCARPYPDDEDTVSDEMIQCTVCEDWYHGRHLDIEVVPEDYCEMTCSLCVNKYPILKCYPQLLVKEPIAKPDPSTETKESGEGETLSNAINGENSTEPAKVESETTKVEAELTPSTGQSKVENESSKVEETTDVAKENEQARAESPSKVNNIPKPESGEEVVDIETVKPKECLIKDKNPSSCSQSGALFWQDGWRSQLCTCVDCLKLYADSKISFILDESEMVEVYEKKGLDTPPPNPDADLAFLSTLDRVQQVEIISEYTDMKSKLVEYLKTFQDSKQVVKAEDIHKFFSSLHNNKRRRLNDDVGPPSFCR